MSDDRAAATLGLPGGGEIEVAYQDSRGAGPAVLYLHGLGSDSGDFILLDDPRTRREFRLVAPDLPGHGGSNWQGDRRLTVDLVAGLMERFVAHIGLDSFHLIGHSLGGAIGLRLARRYPRSILSFINVEGNLVPEDCGVLSRVATEPSSRRNPQAHFDRLAASLSRHPLAGYAEYGRRFRSTLTSRRAWFDYCESLVTLSDGRVLLDEFLTLQAPRSYLYGAQNRHAFLDRLESAGVVLLRIDESSHWPMYSQPQLFIDAIGRRLREVERGPQRKV